VMLESAINYTTDGARTVHDLATSTPPGGPGTITLVADGDYGDSVESATLTVEGLTFPPVGATGIDCSAATGIFPVTAAQIADLIDDGHVHAEVQNSPDVNVFCTVNRHTVRLRYDGPADALDFGQVFLGVDRTINLLVRNLGSAPLVMSSVSSDRPS